MHPPFIFFSLLPKSIFLCADQLVCHGDKPDRDTSMWTVTLECIKGGPTFQVIEVETIAHGAHLIPVYGTSRVPDQFSHHNTLDSFLSYFMNCFIDHHAHEFI